MTVTDITDVICYAFMFAPLVTLALFGCGLASLYRERRRTAR